MICMTKRIGYLLDGRRRVTYQEWNLGVNLIDRLQHRHSHVCPFGEVRAQPVDVTLHMYLQPQEQIVVRILQLQPIAFLVTEQ